MGKYNTRNLRQEKYTLGETEFVLTELSCRDAKTMSKTKFSEEDAVIGMIYITLKQTDKDIQISDIEDLPLGVFTELATLIGKINSKE